MTRILTVLSVGVVFIGTSASPVAAQAQRPVVFGAIGSANVHRVEDQSFGTRPNIGGGIGIEWKRIGLDVEAHSTIGLSPRTVQCGVLNVPCVGAAREGFPVCGLM